MKFMLMTVLLAACSCPALAAWIPYLQTATADEFFDDATVMKSAGKVKLWTLTNHTTALTNLEGKQLLSEKSLTTIDCATKTIGAEVVMTFSGKDATGTTLGNMETPLRMTSIKPSSADDALLKVTCQ